MHQSHANALQRIRVASSQDGDLSGIADWIVQNTADPKDEREQFSYKDHEYQIDIANETAPNVSVIKPSQVGASELQVRVMLAMASIIRNCTVIYTLPTAAFARTFAKGRVDPVIKNSVALSEARNKDVDSSTMKQLGGSFLYFGGTFGQSAAISIPAQVLINDEVDFSNAMVMSTYMSRLGHNKNGGYRRAFSTPTVQGYGISALHDESSQAEYFVKCDHCSTWVAPSFFEHMVVPGWDATLHTMRKDDLKNPNVRWRDAYLRCPHCGKVLSLSNLGDPSKRQWVHKYQERPDKGYQVKPYDVVAYNPPWKTLSYMKDYDRHADWVNFKVGLPFEDAENSFLLERIQQSAILAPVAPLEGAASGCVMGVDVGNISHATVAKSVGGKLKVIYREKIRQNDQNFLLARVKELKKIFGVKKACIDIGPDITVPKQWIAQSPTGHVWAAQYVRQISGSLSIFDADNEEEQIVSANRTALIDEVCKAFNSGLIETPNDEHQKLAEEHLRAMKRIIRVNNAGESFASWVNTGEDHFAHSLFYCYLASLMAGENKTSGLSVILPSCHRVAIGSRVEKTAPGRTLSGYRR